VFIKTSVHSLVTLRLICDLSVCRPNVSFTLSTVSSAGGSRAGSESVKSRAHAFAERLLRASDNGVTGLDGGIILGDVNVEDIDELGCDNSDGRFAVGDIQLCKWLKKS